MSVLCSSIINSFFFGLYHLHTAYVTRWSRIFWRQLFSPSNVIHTVVFSVHRPSSVSRALACCMYKFYQMRNGDVLTRLVLWTSKLSSIDRWVASSVSNKRWKPSIDVASGSPAIDDRRCLGRLFGAFCAAEWSWEFTLNSVHFQNVTLSGCHFLCTKSLVSAWVVCEGIVKCHKKRALSKFKTSVFFRPLCVVWRLIPIEHPCGAERPPSRTTIQYSSRFPYSDIHNYALLTTQCAWQPMWVIGKFEMVMYSKGRVR